MENRNIKTLLSLSIIALLLLGSVGFAVAGKENSNQNVAVPPAHSEAKIKNVIVMVPDGCSQSVQTVSRWYKGEPLTVDDMISGTVSTSMANSVITGSAAAATAFATGQKTTVGFLGVGPRTEDLLSIMDEESLPEPYSPLATVLEGSKLEGKATGLVATSRITHATPAAYACHIHDRGMDNEIMEHMVYEDIDVVFGGGSRHLIPKEEGGKRTDGENLTAVLLDRGYQYVDTRDEMLALESGKVWGLFASSHMQPDMDRAEFAPEEPSLSEMTGKAIDLLSQDEDGFFLMVEGSQIDWAGHAKDPAYMVNDFLAFDDAVRVAMDFAEADGHTLLIVFPDHNTGGMTLGNSGTDNSYTEITVEDLVGPLEGMKLSSAGVAAKINENGVSPENITAALNEWWGIEATGEDVDEILALYDNGEGLTLDYAIASVISKNHTVIGWTTHGHCGEDVPLWTYGPDRPVGHMDNTEIATYIADKFGFDLEETTENLFVEVGSSECPYEYTLDTTTDPENPVLIIGGDELPVSKNILYNDGDHENPVELEGIVVYAPLADGGNGNVYIPAGAMEYL